MPENIVSVDQEAIKSELSRLVRATVQETIDGLLDERADELVGAGRHERSAGRDAYRAGHYRRKLVTTAGGITLEPPKLKGAKFTTAIIERYRRREESVEEAHAGVPVRAHRRDLPQAQLGRGLRERGRDGGRRRGRGRAPRDHRVRRGLHGDADLHPAPDRALAPHTHQQRDRAPQPRDPPPHPRRRHVPGRQVRPHAGDREAEVHSGERMGKEALPGRIHAQRGAGVIDLRDVGPR